MLVPSLPTKIISAVLENVPPTDPEWYPNTRGEVCCLVSRTFLPLARAVLYSEVKMMCGTYPLESPAYSKRLHRLLAYLAGNPDLAVLVKKLDMTVWTDDSLAEATAHQTLAACTRVAGIRLMFHQHPSSPSMPSDIERAIVALSPHLVTLWMYGLCWSPTSPTGSPIFAH